MTDAIFHRSPSLGRVAAATLAVVAILAGAARSSAQEEVSREATKQQLEKRQKELETVRSREKALAGDLERLKQDRADLNARLIETARRIQGSEDKLSATETRLQDLSDQETRVRASIVERQGEIAKLLSAMQRIGRHPPPAVVTRRDDALKMVRGAMLLAAIFPEIKYQAENLTRELDGLVRLQTDITAERDTLAAEGKKLTGERKVIDGLLTRKRRNLALQGGELAKLRAAAEQHAKTVVYLGDLLKRLDKELAAVGIAKYEAELKAAKARQAALKKPKPPEREPNETVIELTPDRQRTALLSPSRIKPAIPFSDSKGLLPMPARGLSKIGYGKSDKFGAKAQGISVETRPNAQVTSPSDGWVAYAGPFRSYGQLLIINAGEGYHILLAGMRRIDVSLGQFVLAGEPIANMGVSTQTASRRSKSARPVLYIEFRKDGQPIDPDPWWAEGPEKVQG